MIKIKTIVWSASFLLILAAVLSSGCGKHNSENCQECPKAKAMASSESSFCFDLRSFFEEVLPRSVFDDLGVATGRFIEPYIVKCEILGETYLHSRKMRLIEDLAGNFPETYDTFMVWGGAGNETSVFQQSLLSSSYEILRCSNCYKTGETLIMILWGFDGSCPSNFLPLIKPEYVEAVSPNHFHINPFSSSVLKLRNGNVVGDISRKADADNFNWTRRMSWNDFQKELNKVIKK